MTRRNSSSLALALGVALLLLGGPHAAAQVPPGLGIVADSGIVTLGPNQKLRITVVSRGGSGEATVRFRRTTYADGTCQAGVCTHALASQTTSAPTTLGQGEGASFEIDDTAFGVRGVVLGSGPSLRTLFEVVDGSTSQIIAILIGL